MNIQSLIRICNEYREKRGYAYFEKPLAHATLRDAIALAFLEEASVWCLCDIFGRGLEAGIKNAKLSSDDILISWGKIGGRYVADCLIARRAIEDLKYENKLRVEESTKNKLGILNFNKI